MQLYILPSGRCSLKFYWLFGVLPIVMLGILVGFLAVALHTGPNILIILFVITLWPTLAMQIKRWHDIGITGWFSLLILIPYLGSLVYIVIGIIPGVTGENRYGPDPINRNIKDASAP